MNLCENLVVSDLWIFKFHQLGCVVVSTTPDTRDDLPGGTGRLTAQYLNLHVLHRPLTFR